MDLLPISLGIARPDPKAGRSDKRKSGAVTDGSANSSGRFRKIPADLKNKILERDNHSCRYCGFHSKKYQEIHFLNHNKQDFEENNLVTACIFCHQCFNLEDVNGMKSGALIWLPEISQAELHHIARAIYVARISQGPVADAARKALDALLARKDEAKARITTDNPFILSMVLKDYLNPASYAQRDAKLKGLRLMPLDRRLIKEADLEFNQFPQILAYWRSKDGPFGGKTPPQWISVYKELLQAA